MECERHLGGYFRAISNALGQNMQRNLDELGLTATQNMFLHHLWFRQEKLGLTTSPKDLEEFFDIKHPTVSGILQRMEASGFVEFQPSQTDRRCKVIGLTQKSLDAVSGATATSKALTMGVNRALAIVANLDTEGEELYYDEQE